MLVNRKSYQVKEHNYNKLPCVLQIWKCSLHSSCEINERPPLDVSWYFVLNYKTNNKVPCQNI